jgi:hypothetical protein
MLEENQNHTSQRCMNVSLSKTRKSIKSFIERLSTSALSLLSSQGIWQIKNLVFFAWLLFFVGGSGFLVLSRENRVPFMLTSAYVAFSIFAHWLNEVLFIRPGVTRSLWREHVKAPRKRRFSVAFIVRLHELGYLILMFFGWFLAAGNIVYRTTGSGLTREWAGAVLHMVSAAGIQTNRTYRAEGFLGIVLTVITSVLGLLFIGTWIGIFIEDTVYIIGKEGRDDNEEARRCKFVAGHYRTSRLRRTRRSSL